MSYRRPEFVTNALQNGRPVAYFGVGSNIMRDKLENRAVDGSSIDLISMDAAFAKDHRLAFNLRGFAPIEPAMAGIEPDAGSECHGALIFLKPVDYEKLWLSEGGGNNPPSYQEIVIDVFQYGKEDTPVTAVAFRAANGIRRMAVDSDPSRRYLSMLVSGAQQLGIKDDYVQRLKNIPTADPSTLAKLLSRKHLIYLSWMYRWKLIILVLPLQFSLQAIYSPQSSSNLKRCFSEVCTLLLLLPGAALGTCVEAACVSLRQPLLGSRIFQSFYEGTFD